MQTHDTYFASIIDMIPRDLYKPSEEESSSKYFMHRKLPLTASERKALSKKRKLEVYGSEESKRKKKDEDGGEDDQEGGDDDDEDDDDDDSEDGNNNDDDVVEMGDNDVDTNAVNNSDADVDIDDGTMLLSKAESIEILRGRLKEKIKTLQSSRSSTKPVLSNANSSKSQAEKKKAREDKHNKDNSKKTNKNINSSSSSDKVENGMTRNQSNSSIADDLVSLNSNSSIASPHTASLDVEMNKLGGVKGKSKASDSSAGKPGTKMKRLRRMLDEATRKRERLQSLKQGGDDDKQRAKQELWNDVLKNASGEKSNAIDLDPKKIKKAIKRREKQKMKSADQWAERKTTLEADINKRLDKRDENVKNRKGSGNSMERGDKSEGDAKSGDGKAATKESGRKNRFTPYEGNKEKEATEGAAPAGKGKGRAGFEGKKPNAFLNNGTGSAGKNPKR